MIERRQRRSESRPVALRYFLDYLAQRAGYAALALADRDGLLLAHSPGGLDTEALAALAPLYARSNQRENLCCHLTNGLPLRVWPISIRSHCKNEVSYLAAVGGPADVPASLETDLNRLLAL